MSHDTYCTTSRGLQRGLPPMRLFELAKKHGIWNPSEIDFTQDRKDWLTLNEQQQDMLLRVAAHFIAGEEAVTKDLLPLINVIADQGRLEEEMYLTTFLWEEAKHVDFFNRFLTEVCEAPVDLAHYACPSYTHIVSEALPNALNALRSDSSPEALGRASAVYNMVVEGMLAETGYYAYFTIMDRHGILPGQREGIAKLKLDESRHIAYGVYLLSRLMCEEPHVWDVVQETMNDLLPYGLAMIDEIYDVYDPIPFDVTKEQFTNYAMGQFQKRLDRIARARDLSIEEINKETLSVIASNDG